MKQSEVDKKLAETIFGAACYPGMTVAETEEFDKGVDEGYEEVAKQVRASKLNPYQDRVFNVELSADLKRATISWGPDGYDYGEVAIEDLGKELASILEELDSDHSGCDFNSSSQAPVEREYIDDAPSA